MPLCSLVNTEIDKAITRLQMTHLLQVMMTRSLHETLEFPLEIRMFQNRIAETHVCTQTSPCPFNYIFSGITSQVVLLYFMLIGLEFNLVSSSSCVLMYMD